MDYSRIVDGYAPREEEPQKGILMEPHINPSEGALCRYADILNDKCFKKILGAERNKDALIEILRVLIPERDIKNITYNRKKRKYNPFLDGHDAIFDVECIGGDGTRFVVEMQQWHQDNFYDRILFYSTFPIQEQVPKMKKGQIVPHYLQYDYKPVYIVSLMAFSLHGWEEDKLLYRFDLRETETGERMSDKLNFIFLEMDKVVEEPTQDAPILEKLSWAMMNMSILRERPAALVEKVFDKLFEACELDSYDSEQRTEIIQAMTLREQKDERDRHNIAHTYWRMGKEAGREEGREEGLEVGREEGRIQERIETAKKLLVAGVDVALIATATGLSIEEIMDL